MGHRYPEGAGQVAHREIDCRLPTETEKGNLANLDQLEGQVNGDQRLRLAISTLRRQLTAGDASSHGDGVSQETGTAADVVAYLEEHSMQELDVATAGEYLVRLEGDEPAAGPTR
jgi:hypothetical protein